MLWLSATGLVIMTAFIAWQVYGRYVENDTPTWTSNGSVLIMAWFILLGASVGIREGNHLSFDVLLLVLGPRTKAVLHTISDLVVVAFAFGMIIYGVQLADTTWTSTIPNIGISGAFNYFAVIWGGLVMLMFSLERILRRMVGLPTARFGDQGHPEESQMVGEPFADKDNRGFPERQ
ncbi:MAG: TRAP transporter small permease [Rhodospirillaceae bacterium]|nr:TRAP transporter small permease [Rhodospirillaceae bacterium]MCA8930901.1 TRAP transporter small permease [Rhodospirillaceae bacterium]MCB1958380.1 TRAP transporter small permease [Rhodocyclaceae bacterium]